MPYCLLPQSWAKYSKALRPIFQAFSWESFIYLITGLLLGQAQAGRWDLSGETLGPGHGRCSHPSSPPSPKRTESKGERPRLADGSASVKQTTYRFRAFVLSDLL